MSEPAKTRRVNAEDSPYRCPFDGKRMIVEFDAASALHYCLHCNYRVLERGLW